MARNYDLSGKVAVVTGGGRGIGKAIALGLAECGAKLVLSSRTQEELEKLASEIKGNGGEATPVVTDLMESEQINALVDASMKTYGHIDILINNAARSFLRPLMDLREDGWDKIFDVNCKAAFLLSRAVAKIMGEQGGGWAPLNVNVNAVGPGLTKTAFSQPIWSNPSVEQTITARIPKGRLAEPEEIVGAVLFLCSEDSSFITGESIYVDGGTLANT
jgi:NAD(P)-dependent dehydrogenase (short-subunit alcohol dehydrogenase family)